MVLVFTITRLGMLYPQLIERFYSNTLFPFIASVLGVLSNWISVSLSDLFYLFLMLYLFGLVVWLILRRIKWFKFIQRLIVLSALIYGSFNIVWGFNYYRIPINPRLNITSSKPATAALLEVFEDLVEETNDAYLKMEINEHEEVLNSIQNSYRLNNNFLSIDTTLLSLTPKRISLSRFFASASISGYYGPFFGEVHINKYVPAIEYPSVLAHEMAHKLGVTSEAEANFYAWYTCVHSQDSRLIYSGNFYLLQYFIYECSKHEGYADIVAKLRPEVKQDFVQTYEYWMKLMNKNVELVASSVNDAYLKTNNVHDGILDYDGVVRYVVDFKLSE